MTQPKLTLISHHLCPFVQRAAIALLEKGVEFERKNIDLANKPDWFLKLSPLGKVLVIGAVSDDYLKRLLTFFADRNSVIGRLAQKQAPDVAAATAENAAGVDVLINNAGVASFSSIPDEAGRQMFATWQNDYRDLEAMVSEMHHAA